MDLTEYVESIRRHYAVAAEAGGDEARAVAERLFAPLEAAIRLSLQDALAAAAEEITTELAPGCVELRLRGREPEFVVTPAPPGPAGDPAGSVGEAGPLGPLPPVSDVEDGGVARINLRLPEHLKSRVDDAAAREGLSVNTWLVRATSAALERNLSTPSPPRRSPPGSQRYTGWSR